MTFATLSGPVRIGPIKEGASRNTGLCVLAQQYDSGTITGTSGTIIRATPFIIPRGAYIIDIVVDALQFTNGVATASVSVGTTLGGSDLMGLTNTLTNSGFQTDVSGASTNNYSTISTILGNPNTTAAAKRTAALNADATIYTTIQIGGGTATQGRIGITLVYLQRNEDGAQNPASA
jgi:hypothetical protein